MSDRRTVYNGFNPTTGRRNYFEQCTWYSSKVYEANKKILSVVFSPNSKGYAKMLKDPLPKHYEILTQEFIDSLYTKYKNTENGNGYTYQEGDNPNDFNNDLTTIRKISIGQVAAISYKTNDGTQTDEDGNKITTKFVAEYDYLYKKSRFTSKDALPTIPKVRNDFYNDDMMVSFDNQERFPCPNGTFYCKVLAAFQNDTQDQNELLRFQVRKVQIETKDYVNGIKKDDWLFFRGEWWIIDSCQQSVLNKSQQYRTVEDTTTVLSLRR